MAKKKAYLISCSDHYAHRMNVVDECLRAKEFETTYVTSDFDHTRKEFFSCSVPDAVQIHTRQYKKNLSAARIVSHWQFARDAFDYIEKQQEPDLIVVLLPPNFLAYYAAKYKKRHPNVKLIFDIFDLWPETFPFGKLKKLLAPVFSIWAWLRDSSLGAADFVITECEMFREMLHLPEDKSVTVYLCAEPLRIAPASTILRTDALDLCYLGAINNIIDIPAICELIGEIRKEKPVTLHIIGKGEREQEFIDSAEAAGADVKFYGPIYDEIKKQEIMCKCHFGLNIMKDSVCVGLTMKSVDYFRFGLPILNNIPEDTRNLVEEEKIGIQITRGYERQLKEITVLDCIQMRSNVRKVFDAYFLVDNASRKYREVLSVLFNVE